MADLLVAVAGPRVVRCGIVELRVTLENSEHRRRRRRLAMRHVGRH